MIELDTLISKKTAAGRAKSSIAPVPFAGAGRQRNKVAILCFNRSGLFHYATQLAQSLATNGQWQVLFITSRDNPVTLINDSTHCRVIRVDAPHTPAAFIANIPKYFTHRRHVHQALQQFNPDVVHITDAYPWYLGWRGLLAAYPLVVTMHDPIPHTGERYGAMLAILNRFLLHHASRLVVHGVGLKKYLSKKVSSDTITVIPHGEYGFFTQWASGVAAKQNSLLFFGRILPYKGLHLLIAVLNKLVAEGKDISLTIAGEGDASSYLLQLTPQARERVTVDNRYIPEEEVAPLFEKHQIVVLPYLDGTQSGVIPIAFALRRPVIASNVGAIGEVVKEGITGLLVPPGNVNLLTQAIIKLLGDSNLRDTLAAKAYQSTQEELSWPAIAEQYGAVYRSVIDNKKL